MAFREYLFQQTEIERNKMLSMPILTEIGKGNLTLPMYIDLLTQIYHYSKEIVPLMMLGAAKMPIHYEWVSKAIINYIQSEVGRDAWLVNDLVACGIPENETLNSMPKRYIEMMVAYAYDMVNRQHPIGILGLQFMLMTALQSFVGKNNIEKNLHELTDLSQQALSFVNHRSEQEKSQLGCILVALDNIEDEGDKSYIVHVTKNFYLIYTDFLYEIGRKHNLNARNNILSVAA